MSNNKKAQRLYGHCHPDNGYGYKLPSLAGPAELELWKCWTPALLSSLEVNPRIPSYLRHRPQPVSKVDYFIQADYPTSTSPIYPVTPEQEAIATNVASLIHDGDTIKLGIGGLPRRAVAENKGTGMI